VTYQAIETYRSQSGFHWDNVHGANIQGDASKCLERGYEVKDIAGNVPLPKCWLALL